MAVGTHKGFVQIWDAAAQKRLNTLEGHSARVGEKIYIFIFEIVTYCDIHDNIIILVKK